MVVFALGVIPEAVMAEELTEIAEDELRLNGAAVVEEVTGQASTVT